MTHLMATDTLRKARFFLSEAVRVGPGEHASYVAFLEAAIVFGRTVTLHLQKELAHHPGFASWYLAPRDKLRLDRLASYFVEQRNYVLKEGALQTQPHTIVAVGGVVAVTGSLSFIVIRGRPWYKLPPRILLEDAIRPAKTWLATWRERRRVRRFLKNAKSQPSASVRQVVYLPDSPFPDRPVEELLGNYFDLLEEVLKEAEQRF